MLGTLRLGLFSLSFVFIIFLSLSTASLQAAPLTLSESQAVLMIDGQGDRDVIVDVGVIDASRGYDFGYVDEDGTFKTIVEDGKYLGHATFSGGDVVDFAIRDSAGNIVGQLSNGDAQMAFYGDISAEMSQKPVVDSDYWQYMTIGWSVGGADVVFDIGGPYDGFAPAGPPVPEPTSLALFGLGAAGVGLLSRRRRSTAAAS